VVWTYDTIIIFYYLLLLSFNNKTSAIRTKPQSSPNQYQLLNHESSYYGRLYYATVDYFSLNQNFYENFHNVITYYKYCYIKFSQAIGGYRYTRWEHTKDCSSTAEHRFSSSYSSYTVVSHCRSIHYYNNMIINAFINFSGTVWCSYNERVLLDNYYTKTLSHIKNILYYFYYHSCYLFCDFEYVL